MYEELGRMIQEREAALEARIAEAHAEAAAATARAEASRAVLRAVIASLRPWAVDRRRLAAGVAAVRGAATTPLEWRAAFEAALASAVEELPPGMRPR